MMRHVTLSEGCPTRPVNRDDALKRRVIFAPGISDESKQVYEGNLFSAYLAKAEWFDFGTVNSSIIRSLEKDASDLASEGFVRLPYDRVVFRVRIRAERQEGPDKFAEMILIWMDQDVLSPEDLAVFRERANVNEDARVSGFIVSAALEETTLYIISRGALCAGNCVVNAANENWHADSPSLIVSLWMLLNVRNIKKRIVEPEAKYQKARARSGKPPARRVTYIDVSQYERALANTETMERKGIGTSPVMHLRRRHWWPRLDTPLPAGRKRHWLPDVLVNQDKDVANLGREKYQVRKR